MQILLILMGLVTAGGGVVMLVKGAGSGSPRGAYAPLGMIGIGLMVAYRAFSDFQTLDTQDLTIMFLFVFALLTLMGMQFFVAGRQRTRGDSDAGTTTGEPEKTEP